MKYLVVNDEHELYRQMYADMFNTTEYDVEQINRMKEPKYFKFLYKIQFNPKLNAHFLVPFKSIWDSYYDLAHYKFKSDEEYTILLLNGSVKVHYNKKFFLKLKKKNTNIKLVLIMHDSVNNARSVQTIHMFGVFDTIFSFDAKDCEKYGFERIYQTFSRPDFVKKDLKMYSRAFFIGRGDDRTELLKTIFKKITSEVDGCKFFITDVDESKVENIKDVCFNKRMSYSNELNMAYNSDCIFEIVRGGQTGVSLRACEAVVFNKKFITNNTSIREMPFYDPRYMRIIRDSDDVDIDFIKDNLDVDYGEKDYFSPLLILKRLEEIYGR